MKSLAGRVFRMISGRWLVLTLVVTILSMVTAGTALAGWRHHGAEAYGHPRAYISTFEPWGSYWSWGPDESWGRYGYRPHRVYKKIYRIYHPIPW